MEAEMNMKLENIIIIIIVIMLSLCSVAQEIIMCETEFCFEEGTWSSVRFI